MANHYVYFYASETNLKHSFYLKIINKILYVFIVIKENVEILAIQHISPSKSLLF